ncbi:MAG: flagellar hook protein FlgE [Betaproteobacteria bacterium]
MSFEQGLSGLNAASRNLDVIGNNVANASTVGFKSADAIFADVYANSLSSSASTSAGIGVSVASVQQQFVQGTISTTSNPLDVAINGNGFFRMDTAGAITYSRNGQFHLDKDGYIVNVAGSKLSGYAVDAAGNIVASAPLPLQVSSGQLQANMTTTAGIGLNLDSSKTAAVGAFDPADSKTYNNSTSMAVFDSLGNSHTLGTYYAKTGANTWAVYGTFDGAALPASLGTLTFKTDGTLDTTATTLPFNVSQALTNGATSPFAFTLDYAKATQFGSSFSVDSLSQDGYTAGLLSGYSIADDGILQGQYSNGQTRTLGQVSLARFTNLNGLEPIGNNQWRESSQSGQAIIGAPGSSNFGVVQSGAVEESNVDLTNELVAMITAQRVYQANAQTIKTQDQMLNTLVNLR